MTECQTKKPPYIAEAAALSVLATAVIFILHPSLGIGDADGYAYLMGARSLHEGRGYVSLADEPLNHWPPGYSLLISLFQDSLLGATILNYGSLCATIGLVYYLLRQSNWSWQASGGLTIALAFGFFRLLAISVHADIFTYALFLTALLMATSSKHPRVLPSMIWALLIPVKLIAVVFLPPALGSDILSSRRSWWELMRAYTPGILTSILGVGCILIFNRLTIQAWVSTSMGSSSFGTVISGAKTFVVSIPREFLFGWHGTIAAPFPGVMFLISMGLAAVCILSLRPVPERKWFTYYGLLCLISSALLLCVRDYVPSVRLLGYGLIVLFLGVRPMGWGNPVWLLYGVVSLSIGAVNALTVNSLGSMDPRYARLAGEVRASYKEDGVVATNSFHLLDLHANIASIPVTNYVEAEKYSEFLWVTLPKYDPIATAVMAIARPGQDWCEQKQFSGGALFARCKRSTTAVE